MKTIEAPYGDYFYSTNITPPPPTPPHEKASFAFAALSGGVTALFHTLNETKCHMKVVTGHVTAEHDANQSGREMEGLEMNALVASSKMQNGSHAETPTGRLTRENDKRR